MRRILTLVIAVILFAALLAPVSAFAAAPAQTTEQIFNSAPLTPRESTDPTLAKYVADVMATIDPNGTLTTYEKAKAAYQWVSKNIEFAAKYTVTYDEDYSYLKDSAFYGFKNKVGPCEVDSAPLVYLFRYIGLNAQWAIGFSGEKYHLWTEVIVGGNTYSFDSYPNMEKSFQKYSGAVDMGVTVVGGFTHGGYVTGGGGENETVKASNVGTFAGMREIAGAKSASTDAAAGSILNVTKTYNGEFPDFTYHIPITGAKEQITMAATDKFYAPYATEADRNLASMLFFGVANKELTAYEIKAGAKISLAGASGYSLEKLEKTNGKFWALKSYDLDATRKHEDSHAKAMSAAGKTYYVLQDGDYLSILQEGYYLLDVLPWNKYCFITDPNSPDFYSTNSWGLYMEGYVVLHVVK